MSDLQLLRELVRERLAAAAEEIFEAVKKTIAGYEEEILLSKRERRLLQADARPGGKRRKHSDQPQLVMCVWDEDFPSDQQQQQQQEVHCETDWTSKVDQDNQEPPQNEEDQEVLSSCQEEGELQELEEDDTIRFIFTTPLVKDELDQLQSGCRGAKGEEDALPSTSAEQETTKAQASDGASSSEPNGSGEEWGGSMGSQSDEGDGKIPCTKRKKKKRRPCLSIAPKLHPTKKTKSRICCKVCGKGFHAVVSLLNHMDVHPKDVCGVCGEHFDTDESFKVHLKTHVTAEICGICGKCFGGTRSLEIHMRIHTGEKPFHCSECGKSFNCRHNMMRHVRIHTGEKPYTCTVCGKCFNDYSTLKRHLTVHVQKNPEPNNTSANDNEKSNDGENIKTSAKKRHTQTMCEVCGKMFHSVVSLVNHAKSHATGLCGVCGTHFDSEDKLKLHLKTHKNGKVCEVCGKCFDSQGNLEIHMRVHTGEKPFLCNECGKSFNCRHNMMRHIRTHTGEKPYLCKVCGRGFSDHSSLKQHGSIHTGEKPHRCEICGKCFHRKTYVRLHMKGHTTKK